MPKLIRGDSRKVNVTVTYANGEPVDITGAVAYLTISASEVPVDDSQAAVTKRWTDHDDPANGRTSVLLTNADTQDIDPGDYYYDVQVVNVGGEVSSKRKKTITVVADTTRGVQ